MAALNYADVYQRALQGQKFTVGVKFADLYDVNGTSTNAFKYVDGKTIKIPRIEVGGMVDYNRDTIATATRKVDNDWESKELSHDRKFFTLVDPADIDETNMALSIGNITSVFTNEQLFPEMDKYMASKLYNEIDEFTGVEIDSTATATGEAVLALFDTFMSNLDEAEVPTEGRILYLTPAKDKLLKAALTTTRKVGSSSSTNDVNRVISMLDDVKKVVVPSSRMKSAYDFTDGAVPAVGAEQINMILVHPKAVISPVKINSIYIDDPSAKTDGKHLYFQRMYWDAFVLERKANAVQINATA